MGKVGIVTDDGLSIPGELVQKFGIEIVPGPVTFGDRVYRGLIDFKTPAELFELLDKSDKFPTTSAPSPADYLEAYRRLSKRSDSIFCLTVSSKVSMSFSSALRAKEMAKDELPGVRIEVFDSFTVLGALGFITLAAARAAASGKDLDEVVRLAREVQPRVNVVFIMGTLSNLAKSGRIGKAQAWVGNMLEMKPILELPISEGIVTPLTRVRTKAKAIERLLEIVERRVGTGDGLHMMVEHVSAAEEAERLREKVAKRFSCVELLVCELNPTASLIVGPGTLGLSFYREA